MLVGLIVQSAHVRLLLAAATTHPRDHSAATWIFPLLLVLVLFMFTRRQSQRRRGAGPAGPRPAAGPQRRPRNARQAMSARPTAWESDTDPASDDDEDSPHRATDT